MGASWNSYLIGDAVNIVARVERLTKTTHDAILLTEQSVDALGMGSTTSHPECGESPYSTGV
jgi:class 3 adenylate cyclase